MSHYPCKVGFQVVYRLYCYTEGLRRIYGEPLGITGGFQVLLQQICLVALIYNCGLYNCGEINGPMGLVGDCHFISYRAFWKITGNNPIQAFLAHEHYGYQADLSTAW